MHKKKSDKKKKKKVLFLCIRAINVKMYVCEGEKIFSRDVKRPNDGTSSSEQPSISKRHVDTEQKS